MVRTNPDRFLPAEGFILAGGASRRFGSDKALYEIDGVPLLVRTYRLLRERLDTVTILAKEPEKYDSLLLPVRRDHYTHAAPLSGILTALEALKQYEWAIIAACDLPNLDIHTINQLWDGRGRLGAVAKTAQGLEPLMACYHRDALDIFQAAYSAGRYRLQDIIIETGIAQVAIEHPDALNNLNTPEV